VAVKIRLKRLGKIREPYYRVVVADSRTKRDGRAIEEIGKYHPKLEPSLIDINSERVQYWLSVGAQPTEQVQHLLTITGDWQKFKGQPGAEGTLKTGTTGEAKADKKDRYEELVKESLAAKEAKAAAKPARSGQRRDAKKAEPAEAPPAQAPAAEAVPAEAVAAEPVPAEAAPAEAAVAEPAEAPAAEAPAEAAPAESAEA
jgi:small subunit ribosomal protein S16